MSWRAEYGALEDDDPRLDTLIERLAAIVESPTSQLARLEARRPRREAELLYRNLPAGAAARPP